MLPVIEVNNLNKKFCGDLKRSLLYGINDIGKEFLGIERDSKNLRKKEFWALKDINFKIEQGQSVGLIGSNGAGKSTLLRIISGLIKPDSGSVCVRGRVAPLIALGAGFNPILTGRENIFVNMAILGLTQQQIKERFDEVVDFSGLDHALDMPVQTYSSGMAARLGFSCAIFTKPDILLIDEVLAVGDLKFRAKCYRKLAELKKDNTTFLMVSHSPQSILSICDKGLYLKKGVLLGAGTTNEIMSQYETDLAGTAEFSANFNITEVVSSSNGLKVKRISFKDEKKMEVPNLESGNPGVISLTIQSDRIFDNLNIQIMISDSALSGERILFFNNNIDDLQIQMEAGSSEVQIRFPFLGLNPGLYSMKVAVYQDQLYLLDVIEAFNFLVKSDKPTQQSLYNQPRNWTIEK